MLNILIVDDHPVVRRGLRQIFQEHFTDVTCAEAASTQEAIERLWQAPWDLMVLDVSMPGRNGLEVLENIKELQRRPAIIVLSIHPEEQYAFRAMKAGADAYLTKESAPELLVKAAERVLGGRKYVSELLAERLVSGVVGGFQEALGELSNREMEVLCRIASGKTASQIAKEMALSPKTIATHRSRALRKTGLKTNAELTSYALRNRLVPWV